MEIGWLSQAWVWSNLQKNKIIIYYNYLHWITYWVVIGAACVVVTAVVRVVDWAVVIPEVPNENPAVLVVLNEKPVDAVGVVLKEKPVDDAGVVPREKPVDAWVVLPKEKPVDARVVVPKEKPVDVWVVPPKEKPVDAWVVDPREKPVDAWVVFPKEKLVGAWVVLPKEKLVGWVFPAKEKPVEPWVFPTKEKPVEAWVVPNEKLVGAWVVPKEKPVGADVLTDVVLGCTLVEEFVAKPKLGVPPREKEGVAPKLNVGFIAAVEPKLVFVDAEGETPKVGTLVGNAKPDAKKITNYCFNFHLNIYK